MVLGRAVNAFLVAGFASAVGHLAWYTLFGPSLSPSYFVGGHVTALAAPDADACRDYAGGFGAAETGLPNADPRVLYVRRVLYIPQQPRHAWIQLLGYDRIKLYVNGSVLSEQIEDGFPVAMVVDLAPHLVVGTNVIAVEIRQYTIGRPPVLTVDGLYNLVDGDHSIKSDKLWRCSSTFERRKGSWWFQPTFDDRHWPYALLEPASLRAKVVMPPRATTAISLARWIAPFKLSGGPAALRRDFILNSRPRAAWLRITATCSYRLAINGVILDEEEDHLDAGVIIAPVRRSYDVTPFVHRGDNTISLAVTSSGGPCLIFADGEVEENSGTRLDLATGEEWFSRAEPFEDWLSSPRDPSSWQPCRVNSGYLDMPPWLPRRDDIPLVFPFLVSLHLNVEQGLLILLVGLVTLVICKWAAYLLAVGLDGAALTLARNLTCLALVLPTLAIAAALLATYDSRFAIQEVYRPVWIVAALLTVLVQWLIVRYFRRSWSLSSNAFRWHSSALRTCLFGCILLAVVLVGFWLRMRHLTAGPVTHDEVTAYRSTKGFTQRWFPSRQIHPDIPVQYLQTSELLYCGTVITSLFTDDPRLITRIPALFWGTLTILLIYRVGGRVFSPSVGLVAAALYALSPNCIQMANYGRYLSQVQFMSLLTVYCFWCTLRGAGPINRRALWLTTLAFVAMYLSWEAAALLAPGMIVAALIHRRGRLRTVLGDQVVWAALLVAGLAVLLQYSHRELQLTHQLWYGTGATDASIMPMWPYPVFEPWYFFWVSTWSRDTLLPALSLLAAAFLGVRHAFRRPIRFFFVIYLVTCLFLSLLLSLKEWRYGYFLVPLPILLSSAAIVAAARHLSHLPWHSYASVQWRRYASAVSTAVMIIMVGLASGIVLQLVEMTNFRISNHSLEALGIEAMVFPPHERVAEYLREHVQPGDIILASRPHVMDQLMDRATDFWPENTLFVQPVLDDKRSTPLHHYSGTEQILNLAGLQDVFARHKRIWFVAIPVSQRVAIDTEMAAYFREHMDVVYEDFTIMVLFRGNNHRSAAMRQLQDTVLLNGQANFLPGTGDLQQMTSPGSP